MRFTLRLSIILAGIFFAQVSTANGGRWVSNEINSYGMWTHDLGFFNSNGNWVSGKNGYWYIKILFGESKSVFKNCQKNGKVYIHGGSTNGYSCSIASTRKFTESPSEDEYTISVDISKEPPKVSSGTLIISTIAFATPRIVEQTFKPSELNELISLIDIKKVKKDLCCKYKLIKGLSNSKINSMRYEEEGHSENYYLKAKIENKTFYIVPAILVDDGLSSRVISAIFINDGSLRSIGFVDGEYNYVAPDIDQDGFPEVVFGEGNSEGWANKCIKVYPMIKTLLEYGSS